MLAGGHVSVVCLLRIVRKIYIASLLQSLKLCHFRLITHRIVTQMLGHSSISPQHMSRH